jgi:hypothetical protein
LILAELGPLIEPSSEGGDASDWPSHAAAVFAHSLVYIGHKEGHEELYDLDADPTEARDLSNLSGSRPTLARFRHDLAQVLAPLLAPEGRRSLARGRERLGIEGATSQLKSLRTR